MIDGFALVGQPCGCDHLGNTTALGPGKKARGQPDHQHPDQRRVDKRQPRPLGCLLSKLHQCQVGQAGEHHHQQPRKGGRGPERDASTPADRGEATAQQQ